MAQLIAPVVDGVLQQNNTAITSASTKNIGSSELGKDSFLQLLVCQMQNQDPLNPSTDTEFVSQLATFSQLEQLQNLTSVSEQSQAFTLVGKEVILSVEDTNGKLSTISGTVDFITINKNKVKLSVDGELYDMDKLLSVVDSAYSIDKSLPGIEKKIQFEYDADKPEDLTFEVKLGENDMAATEIALAFGEQVLDSKMVSLKDNKVTVKKEAFADLPNGVYNLTVAFNNNPYYTTVEKMLQVTVKNSEVTISPKETENTEEDSGIEAADGTAENTDT